VFWTFEPGLALLALLGLVPWFILTQVSARAALVVWLVCAALTGFVVWFADVWHASDQGAIPACGSGEGMIFGPSWSGGGQASQGSNVTSALIGLVLWLAGGAIVRLFPRRAALAFVGYVVVYLAVLVGFWYVAPHIWGPRHC
jgi:hypothetical protein